MDLHAVCCTLLLLTWTGACFAQQLELPEKIDTAVGENVVITPIQIPDPPHDFINWRFNVSNAILVGSPDKFTVNPLYTGRVSLNSSTLALELRNLAENDTGEYSLSVDTHKAASTSLQVFVPISSVRIVPNNTELIELSSTVNIVCSASGSSPSFIWLNGSSEVTAGGRVQLTDNNSSLTITSVIRGDTGPYQCEASNAISKKRSPPLSLTISYGPENVTVEADPVGHFYSPGSNVKLTCSAESSPAAEFQWAVNGAELGEMGQELRLNNIQSSQSGNYTCIAHNRQTLRYSTSEPFSITVLEKILGAEVTGPTDLLIDGVSNATLSCKASGSIHSVEWMKDNQALSASDRITFSNDNRSVMISSVRRSDNGEYRCTLSNPFSSDTATYTVIINFGPDNVTINGPSEVEVGTTVTLICKTESTPSASYTWMFNGSSTEVIAVEYTVKKADFRDTGNYSCTASNNVTGFKASGSHGLVVKDEAVGGGGGGQTLSSGAIAGIVIGVLIGVAAVAGLIFYFVKGKEMLETRSGGNKQNGATANEGHELHYADLKYPKRQPGVSTVAKGHTPSHGVPYQQTTSNPGMETIYSDVRKL